MSRDSNPTSVRCSACGVEKSSETRSSKSLAAVYQIVVACASCRTPFVVLARN